MVTSQKNMEQDLSHKIIWDFQRAVINIYKEKELKSLAGSGPQREYDVNGRQIIAWYFNVVRKGQSKFKDFNFHKCFDDLIFCSDEILYFTGLLYLYVPYLNNPINDGHWFADRMIYPNHQNIEAKRFSMFANTLSEKVYNYWDRIGDLIAAYYPDKISPRDVFFPRAIDIIPTKYYNSDNYKWLKDFKEGEYKKMNEKRKEVVHYLTHDTDFRHKHIDAVGEREEIEKLIKERDGLPDFFKSQIKLSLDGFEKTILLIEEITANELRDVS